jgi:hypothetical protein
MRTSLVISCLIATVLLACSTAQRGSSTGTSTSTGGAGSGSDAGAGGSTGPADGDGGLPDAFGPVPDGGVFVQFVKSDEAAYFDPAQEMMPTGTIAFGAPNTKASDDAVATLTRKGGEAALGTDGAEEIVSNRSFGFGTFRYRLSLATCASTEEVVNGPFAYFNDGSLAPDGLAVNREIDIEILCGEPWLINLTIWTEYTDDQHFKNQSRVIDTRTGKVLVFANDQFGNVTSTEDHPELLIPSFPQAGEFYEMGFTWAPDHVTYFLVNGGSTLTLWEATDATRIPQAPMEQHFNIWAPGNHWSTGDTAAVPANATTLTLDWFRYDPQ